MLPSRCATFAGRMLNIECAVARKTSQCPARDAWVLSLRECAPPGRRVAVRTKAEHVDECVRRELHAVRRRERRVRADVQHTARRTRDEERARSCTCTPGAVSRLVTMALRSIPGS